MSINNTRGFLYWLAKLLLLSVGGLALVRRRRLGLLR